MSPPAKFTLDLSLSLPFPFPLERLLECWPCLALWVGWLECPTPLGSFFPFPFPFPLDCWGTLTPRFAMCSMNCFAFRPWCLVKASLSSARVWGFCTLGFLDLPLFPPPLSCQPACAIDMRKVQPTGRDGDNLRGSWPKQQLKKKDSVRLWLALARSLLGLCEASTRVSELRATTHQPQRGQRWDF